MTVTATSFFTGIGGLDLAAERAGFTITHMTEISPYCRAVLRRHWPHVTLLEDIRNVTSADIGHPTLIFGGFPCQDISIAGAGGGLAGERSGLWFELARIIRDARPRLVVLENVPAITVRGGTTVAAQLAAIGYDGVWLPVRAADFGAPHRRERWFYVGALVDHADGQRRPSTAAGGLHSPSVGAHREEQPLSFRASPQQSRPGRRAGARAKLRRSATQTRMGGDADGVSARLDLAPQWPAGSWLPQSPHEPDRLTAQTAGRRERIAALGNAVVPQQAYPIFHAAIQYLEATS